MPNETQPRAGDEMSIVSLSYSEFENEKRCWRLSDATFTNINLVVGKNATGKSRLLSVINSFSRLLTGKQPPFDSAQFQVVLKINGSEFEYQIICKRQQVISESLKVDGNVKFTRDENGQGTIWYEKQNASLEFKLPSNALVAVNKRDEIQHPYLIELNKWAQGVSHYQFGSEFGKNRLMDMSEAEMFINNPQLQKYDDPSNLVVAYSAGYFRYQEAFDKAIIADMQKLGYSLNDVGSDNLQSIMNLPVAVVGIFTVESDLDFKNPQMHMSQGMFRALALIILLNIAAFSKEKNLILIDDIGEGLDFERAIAIIKLLIEKAEENNLQLVMTSNDRFVMNSVPLEYWAVLKRRAGVVNVFNIRNAEKQFKEFKFIGLNNFDFFASDYFDPEASNE